MCWPPVEASTEERAMAALGPHPIFGNVWPRAPSKGQYHPQSKGKQGQGGNLNGFESLGVRM